VASRKIYFEPLGWTEDEVTMLFVQQLKRKMNDVGIDLAPDLEEMLGMVSPQLAGG
jgi:ribonucleoside-diphosphate reductase beta chain